MQGPLSIRLFFSSAGSELFWLVLYVLEGLGVYGLGPGLGFGAGGKHCKLHAAPTKVHTTFF